ncbi:MAG: hypothetical protein ABI480_03705 [Chitinophagaceae bacterium]
MGCLTTVWTNRFFPIFQRFFLEENNPNIFNHDHIVVEFVFTHFVVEGFNYRFTVCRILEKYFYFTYHHT